LHGVVSNTHQLEVSIMSGLSASNNANNANDVNNLSTNFAANATDYEPPRVDEVGEAAEKILGSFHFDMDSDWFTKWT
jgi:hypothetical protein